MEVKAPMVAVLSVGKTLVKSIEVLLMLLGTLLKMQWLLALQMKSLFS